MQRLSMVLAMAGCLVLSAGAGLAQAGIGEPQGSFNITVRQGATIVAQDTVTIGPGGDLADLKNVFQDGDPEDFTQIGTTALGDPIILKVTTDGDANFRVAHWYIDVPVSLTDIYSPGPSSLFAPGAGKVSVTVTGFEFDNLALASPFVVDNDTFYTSFMRDVQGHFYNLPQSHGYNAFGNGIIDIQVPGKSYLDGLTGAYDFDVLATGLSSSWRWNNILPPTMGTSVTDLLGNTFASVEPGYVFELGLATGFVVVPEPATMALLAPCLLVALRRRRRR